MSERAYLEGLLSFLFFSILGVGDGGNGRLGGFEQGLRAERGLGPCTLTGSKLLLLRRELLGEWECLEGLNGETLLLRHKLRLEVTLLLKLLDLLWSQLLRNCEAETLA